MNSEKETVIIGDKKYYVIDGHLNLSKKNINAISEIIGLNKLTNLYSLDLSDNFIETINGLENLKNLQSLNLDNNLITKIQGLENFQNLRELKLGTKEKVEFGISKIEGLENLIKLRFLFIK
jgi:Leucine-rich repeat (LRR) protein